MDCRYANDGTDQEDDIKCVCMCTSVDFIARNNKNQQNVLRWFRFFLAVSVWFVIRLWQNLIFVVNVINPSCFLYFFLLAKESNVCVFFPFIRCCCTTWAIPAIYLIYWWKFLPFFICLPLKHLSWSRNCKIKHTQNDKRSVLMCNKNQIKEIHALLWQSNMRYIFIKNHSWYRKIDVWVWLILNIE